jgi:HD-like signal output (HDOD) protein
MLNPADFRRALLSIDALGSTPAILAQVATLAKQPDTDLTRICEIVRNDGPLSADIIRISNSPYYSLTSAHGNLAAAANHIGLQEVVRVVNLSLSRQLFARDLGSYGMPAYDYWSASVATALVMESLAERSGLDKEDAYTIGILHGIGRLLINRVIEENGLSIFWDGLQPSRLGNVTPWDSISPKRAPCSSNGGGFHASTCEVVGGQFEGREVR